MDSSIEGVFQKLKGAYSPNTLRGYRCDFLVFERCCQ